MMSIIEDKYGRGLIAPIRPEQIDPKAQQINYFPLDAFEFTDPSNTTAPVLRMKEPWSFDVPALTLDGQSTATWATVPGQAWYMGLYSIASRYFILGDSPETTLDIGTFSVSQTSSGVKGGITLDLSGYTNWTISFQWAGTWQWVSSSTVGSKNGPWDWDSGTNELYIYSGLPYHLPFTLRDNLEIISDMLLFESVKSDEYMSGLLSGKSRLGIDGESINSAGNVIIDGDGFRWYGGGDASIILGETAEFNNVTVQGNYEAGVSGWRINANGDVEFNDGVFRGDITGASGTFAGSLSGADITGATGRFSDLSGLTFNISKNVWVDFPTVTWRYVGLLTVVAESSIGSGVVQNTATYLMEYTNYIAGGSSYVVYNTTYLGGTLSSSNVAFQIVNPVPTIEVLQIKVTTTQSGVTLNVLRFV